MRMGDFVLRVRYMIGSHLRLEGIWVPVYRPSIYRFDLFDMPAYIDFTEDPLRGRC